MKEFLKKHLPKSAVDFLRYLRYPRNTVRLIYEAYLIRVQPRRYKKIIEQLRGKEKIYVAFFTTHSSEWKYDTLYKLMCEHSRFEPIIVVCPVVNFGRENMLVEMDKCYNMFKEKGYHVIRTYDIATDSYLDVKKTINPDIIFYPNPYKGLIDDRYFITEFLDRLTCYVPYAFGNSNGYQWCHNLFLHNVVWRLFAETEVHKSYAIRYAQNKGSNVVVTGYPGIDVFLDKTKKIKDPWKIKDTSFKRIIWAPHHTFAKDEIIHYSCFLDYYQFMLEMGIKYQDKIQIAFKPHPLLRVKLENYWGKEKTDAYYSQWENMPNGMLADGEYVDLFLSSDAMIHDSGSFITEYLYTLKPVMRTDNEISLALEFNSFAQDCLSVYYHAKNSEDIENFIIDIINGQDPLKEERTNFYQEKLLPPNGILPSQSIFNIIIHELL